MNFPHWFWFSMHLLLPPTACKYLWPCIRAAY
jgi:hypothetical protein